MLALPLVGVALGAFFSVGLCGDAYVDYLRATTKIARANGSDAAWDARTALADAKARIAIYGMTSVLHAISTLEATGAAIRGADGRRAFMLLAARCEKRNRPIRRTRS